jgi:predicted amidophosphoribosyltransferase
MKTFAKHILKLLADILFPLRPTELLVGATTYEAIRKQLSPQVHAIGTVHITSLLPYRMPEIQALCIEAKFHKSEKAYELLGKVLGMYIRNESIEKSSKEIPRKVVLVPIPLGAKRRAERGYNQVEEIAKNAVVFLNTTTQTQEKIFLFNSTILTRTKETKPQMTLGRAERMKNMTGVFEANAQLFSDTLYIVIDDVVTTGSTLAAAHSALTGAGANHILFIALAH